MPLKIVVTGPESSGKTKLCTQLTEHYKGTMIPEFARTYLKTLKRKYRIEDVKKIGLGQYTLNQSLELDSGIMFCDTDALTSYIWAIDKFHSTSILLMDILIKDTPDLYLLCFPDLKWEFDPLRENPKDGDRLFILYLKEILKLNAPFVIINGIGQKRINNAIFNINNLFPEFCKFAR